MIQTDNSISLLHTAALLTGQALLIIGRSLLNVLSLALAVTLGLALVILLYAFCWWASIHTIGADYHVVYVITVQFFLLVAFVEIKSGKAARRVHCS